MKQKHIEYHREFIRSLPSEPLKLVFGKIVALFFFGSITSLLFIIARLLLLKTSVYTESNTNLLLNVLFQDIPFVLLAYLLFYRKNTVKEIVGKLWPKISNKSTFLIIGILLVDFIIGFALNYISFGIFGSAEKSKWLSNYIDNGANSISLSYLMLIVTSFSTFIVIALFEEFIFRFTLYRFLRKHNMLLTLIVSSLLFALIHNGGFVTAFVFGIMIALYYEYSNNFIGSVIIHALSNQFVVFYTYYFVYQLVK